MRGEGSSLITGGDTRPAGQPHAVNPVTPAVIPAMMASVEEVEVVAAHNERATLRAGDVFLKIDADQTRTDVEAGAMAMAPTPEILWRKPPALAVAAVSGTAPGRLGEPSTASPTAWAAAGAAARMLHDAPLPPWPGRSPDVLPAGLVTRNRQLAETALRPWTPVFIHGDLQAGHVFADGDEVTGVVDWSGRPRATRCSTPPSSRPGTRSSLATSSPATAPTSTATSGVKL